MVYHKVFGIGKITHHENNGDITVVFNFNKLLELVFVCNLDRLTKDKRYIKELDYIKYESNKEH